MSARRGWHSIAIVMLLWICPSLGAFSLASGAQSDSNESEARFQADAPAMEHRLVIASGFLFVLAVAAGVTVIYARRQGISAGGERRSKPSLRLLEARRLSRQLTVLKIEVAPNKVVVFADNGHQMLLLDSITTTHAGPDGTRV